MPLCATRRGALEATRGTLVAAHAAAGLCAGESREALRLVRAAEGLLRAAAAVLGTPAPVAGGGDGAAAQPGDPPNAAAPLRPRRRRRRRRRARARSRRPEGGTQDMHVDGHTPALLDGGPAGASAGTPAGEDAMSEDASLDDSWADGLRRASAGAAAAVAVGGKGKGKDKDIICLPVDAAGGAGGAALEAPEAAGEAAADAPSAAQAVLGAAEGARDGQVLVLLGSGRQAAARMVDLVGLELAPAAGASG
ncbi:unnamed protein product, partial [Prorocentrum cordatum]